MIAFNGRTYGSTRQQILICERFIHPFFRIDVQKDLRRRLDFRNCLVGVAAPDDREIRDRVELKEVRARQLEEIPHHEVRRPRRLQLAQAVEHVKCTAPFLFDEAAHRECKRLKAVRELNRHNCKPRLRLKERRMRREADVDDVPPVRDRLADKGLHEDAEVRKVRDGPDDIVTEADVVKGLIKRRNSRFHTFKCSHRAPPLL